MKYNLFICILFVMLASARLSLFLLCLVFSCHLEAVICLRLPLFLFPSPPQFTICPCIYLIHWLVICTQCVGNTTFVFSGCLRISICLSREKTRGEKNEQQKHLSVCTICTTRLSDTFDIIGIFLSYF